MRHSAAGPSAPSDPVVDSYDAHAMAPSAIAEAAHAARSAPLRPNLFFGPVASHAIVGPIKPAVDDRGDQFLGLSPSPNGEEERHSALAPEPFN